MNQKVAPKYNPSEFFQQETEKAAEAEKIAAQRFNTLAFTRILVFIGIISLIWICNRTGENWLIAVILMLVVAFFVLMKQQQAVKRERNFRKNLQIVNEDEIARLNFQFKRADTGVHYQQKEHSYSSDIDVFGEYSLYRLLNRTRTAEGSKRIAGWLKNHASLEEILMRQEASAEWSQKPEVQQQWEATALLHEHAAQQVGAFKSWVSEKLPDDLTASLKWRYYPLVTLVVAVLAIINLIPGWVLILSLGWHLVLLKRFQATVESITNRTTALGFTLTAYSELLALAETAPYHSRWWKQRKALIDGSSKAIKEAGNLFEKLDYRNNVFFSLFVGIPTLWDIQCIAGLEKWKASHHSDLYNWLDVLADTEAMISLSGHAYAHPDYTTPTVTWENDVRIEAINMGHPLIPKDKRISNSFTMTGTGQTVLITGSNMSGKSTFLRTIGLNIVLAQVGCVVSADKFACSPVRIFSSMRTQDSLEENTSSFYAELKRLRQLLQMAEENNQTPVFYMLDEILKGTNSADRHRGAEALIRQLHPKNASGLVSTHDLELGQWGAEKDYVQNFHFRSDVEDGKLHFDYKLHEGICKSFNASELMKMMGIDMDPEKS
ncbi:DNA mismatch repair protein MutS [Dyadobacter luteus]|uniref:DNA mismatch repair protein MutS n=1 Tax=Dyadobacter luteus TaxID=2259619 RepID=A0A3D8YCA0_9BACT|nr:MutS family DNA mismatch repair protein [Dyadobacter luteus]REA62012.1 DNA mismatch repair protein MutS [Dyadobacter luteus]